MRWPIRLGERAKELGYDAIVLASGNTEITCLCHFNLMDTSASRIWTAACVIVDGLDAEILLQAKGIFITPPYRIIKLKEKE